MLNPFRKGVSFHVHLIRLFFFQMLFCPKPVELQLLFVEIPHGPYDCQSSISKLAMALYKTFSQ